LAVIFHEVVMAADNFDACLALTWKYEGAYSDHSADPGGATNLGITCRTLAAFRGRPVSKVEVRALRLDEAVQSYRRNYWDVVRGNAVPRGVDAAVFDHAVNSGPRAAVRMLQSSLGVKADSAMGAATSAALSHCEPVSLIRTLVRRRSSFLARLRTFRIFGRGWTARVRDIEKATLAMAKSAGA
jgi:lysozyme family protein